MVNGYDRVYVERHGKLERTAVRFVDEAHLHRIIDKIVSQVGRRVDEASPMVDARLPDGSPRQRDHPAAVAEGPDADDPEVLARPVHGQRPDRVRDADREVGAVPLRLREGEAERAHLRRHRHRQDDDAERPVGVRPGDERIVTIEDAAELQLQQEHVITLESRPPNIEGQGEVRIRELVKNALRMRPDRIIVGEVRGAETLDMLQAMNTGHEGSLTTIHANSPRDALARLETLVLTAGVDLPLRAIREQIARAFDVLVQISRLVDGSRRITHVTEVLRMESDVITLQDIFIAKPPDEEAAAARAAAARPRSLHRAEAALPREAGGEQRDPAAELLPAGRRAAAAGVRRRPASEARDEAAPTASGGARARLAAALALPATAAAGSEVGGRHERLPGDPGDRRHRRRRRAAAGS